MRAGAKVGLLVAAVAVAVGLVVVLGGGPDAETTPAETAPSAEHAPKAAPKPRRAAKQQAVTESDDAELKPATRTSTEFRLTGQVVEAPDKPVADAVVRALRSDGVATETKSGADGRFTVRCGPRPCTGAPAVAVGVTATSGPKRAAYVAYDLMEAASEEDDLGDLQLEPAVPMTARVMDGKGPAAGAVVYLGTFFGTVFATATTDARGVAKFETSPVSDAWLFAYAPGRGRARGEVPDNRDPAVPLVLTLSSRTLTISVAETPGDSPISDDEIGARIATDADGSRLYSSFVPPVTVARTAADGSTRIDDVSLDDAVEVRRLSTDSAPISAWQGPRMDTRPVVASAGETEVRIEVPIGRTIRWRIAAGETPSPPEGALVRLRGVGGGAAPRGPGSLKVEGGDLVGVGFSTRSIDAVAVADDGSIAALTADSKSDRGADAVFKKPRRVDVVVREENDDPVVGAEIGLKTEAEALLCEPIATDDQGRAAFEGLASNPARIAVSARSRSPVDERRLGVVDLSKGDGRVDVRLPRARKVVLRVTTDGERKLPSAWKVLVDQTWAEDAQSDSAAAEIRFAARPHAADGSLHVLLRATGFRDVEFDVRAATSTLDVAFDHGVTILAEVRSADGKPRGALQQWTDAARWMDWRDQGYLQTRRPGPDGRWRFDGLPPGRWRLYDMISRTGGAAADVAVGDAPVLLRLDVTRSGAVTGRVIGPDEKPVGGAWIDVRDDATDVVGASFSLRTYSGADGTFTVTVPGDRPLHLRVGHSLLRADPERGAVDVVEPRDGVVLRLLTGPVIEFAAPEVKDPFFSQRMGTVQLFRGAAEGEPAASLTPVATDATHWRVGGFDPGRYNIWIDWPGGAPVTLFDVEVRDGVLLLGEIRSPRGSSVRIRIVVPDGEAPPPVTAWVTRVDSPKHTRGASSTGQMELTVSGLGPGRFEIRVGTRDNSGRGFSSRVLPRTVDLDGDHDVVVDYPVR